MRLEGTLDAFSLPDIFQLLSFTKKTGTLHLRRPVAGTTDGDHGVVHLRDGAVTGARSDVRRQALGRRIVGAGLVDDQALAAAMTQASAQSCGLARALADSDAVPQQLLGDLAVEQATDAVFDLLRWPDGEFAFVVDEPDPDDVGVVLPVDDVVNEARRRLASWETSPVPPSDAVVSVVTSPVQDPSVTRDEWALLALVDGRRTIADFVTLSGRGEYAVVCALAGLEQRGLVAFGASADELVTRQELVTQLETGSARPSARTTSAARSAAPSAAPSRAPARAPVIPERPEPFTPPRRPEHAEPVPAYARASTPAPRETATVASGVGDVHGAVAMQPAPSSEPAPATGPQIERDPSVNKSLLLRLIAGVRGL